MAKTDMRNLLVFSALLFCFRAFSQSPSDPPTEDLILINDTVYLVKTAPSWMVVTDTVEFGLQIQAIDNEIARLLAEKEKVLQQISDYKKLKETRRFVSPKIKASTPKSPQKGSKNNEVIIKEKQPARKPKRQ